MKFLIKTAILKSKIDSDPMYKYKCKKNKDQLQFEKTIDKNIFKEIFEKSQCFSK